MPRLTVAFLAAILAAALGGGLIWYELSPDNKNPPSHETAQAQQARYQPGGSACDPQLLRSLAGPQSARERERCADAAEEHRLKSNDLLQQTRAADAAERGTDLSYSQTRMSLANVITSFLTLVAACLAAFFAWMAADENRKGNVIQERESRPALVPGDWDAEVLGLAGSGRPVFRFKWMNVGKQPAIIISGKFYRAAAADPANVIQVGEWIDDAPNRKPHQLDKAGTIIPPGVQHVSSWISMGGEPRGTLSQYVYGKVTYQNALDRDGETWMSEICGFLHWLDEGSAVEFYFEVIDGTVKVT